MKGIAVFGFLLSSQICGRGVAFPNATEGGDLVATATEVSAFALPDNGMALGVVPDGLTTGGLIGDNSDSDLTTHVPSQAHNIESNHRNFTPSPYLGSFDFPPLLNQVNYDSYYKQNEGYDPKPIKFEENSSKNKFVAPGLGSYLEDDVRYPTRGAFPYAYERLPHLGQSPWSSVGYNHIGYDHRDQEQGYQPEHRHPEGESKDLIGWKKAWKLFTVLAPLGLLLATFTPNIISINSTTDQRPLRQRSAEEAIEGPNGANYTNGGSAKDDHTGVRYLADGVPSSDSESTRERGVPRVSRRLGQVWKEGRRRKDGDETVP